MNMIFDREPRGVPRARSIVRVALVAAILAAGGGARSNQQSDSVRFTGVEAMVAMRDGVRLYTQIYTPTDAHGALPVLLLRTPYGIGNLNPAGIAAMRELAAEGFIFVTQDIRGRFKSEGNFVMLRQPHERGATGAAGIDESTDTYDTIDWLLKNVPGNNGRVATAGTSYGAWLSVMSMLDPHPALKAVVAQASPADMWIGDDFHHNGGFRLSYGLEYAYMMESSREITSPAKLVDRHDAYDWYLALGPLANVNAKYFHGRIPTWNDFVKHPDYDAFWKRQAFAPWLTRVTVPTLNVAGWWDQEDFYGPIKIYELLERYDKSGENFLVVGPWNHGGWSRSDGRTLGPLDFGSETSVYYRQNILTPFLAYYLKDKGKPPVSEALTFRTGTNQWIQHDAWPPRRDVVDRPLYFRANRELSFTPPPSSAASGFDSYVSDPRNPVPYRVRPIEVEKGWTTWQVQDQRFVDHRPDVLSWETEPLAGDVTVSGRIAVNLFASTSGSDSDWIVKLIDAYPDQYPADEKMGGYQLMIAGDVFRGRYLRSMEKPRALVPNAVEHYTIQFPANDHVFRAGHRIMVQVQSTWFPVIDRNPQRFVPSIFQATEADFRPATQRVYRSGAYRSRVVLPVVEERH